MIEFFKALGRVIVFSFLTAVWTVSIYAAYDAHLNQKQMIAYVAAAQACQKPKKKTADLET